MDWSPIILNLTESKYAKYDEWLENFGCWDNTVEHVLYTSNFLTNATQDLPFLFNLCSIEEPKASNICNESIFGYLYPFIKPLPVRYEKSDSCTSIDYKPPLI